MKKNRFEITCQAKVRSRNKIKHVRIFLNLRMSCIMMYIQVVGTIHILTIREGICLLMRTQ